MRTGGSDWTPRSALTTEACGVRLPAPVREAAMAGRIIRADPLGPGTSVLFVGRWIDTGGELDWSSGVASALPPSLFATTY